MTPTKILTIVIVLFFCVGIIGCEEDNESKCDIYENHTVSACGIKDPLKNLECLKKYNGSTNIFLLKDTVTGEEYFDLIWNDGGERHSVPGLNARIDCSGNTLFHFMGSPSDEQNKNIKLIDTIYLKKCKK